MLYVVLGVVSLALVLVGGAVMTVDEKVDANGVVQTDPVEIARAHGVSLDVEALGRMMVSEVGNKSAAQIAVGWAARNMASKRRVSIAELLLRGRTGSGNPSSSEGRFGAQNTGKYASTRLPSTAQSRRLAGQVLTAAIPDPTAGATQWDAPRAQDALTVAGAAGYSKTADEIAASRSKASTLVMVPGVSNIRFWVPKDKGGMVIV